MSEASERNLPPTARRRASFREQGRVALSPLPGAAVLLLLTAACLSVQGPRLVPVLRDLLKSGLQSAGDSEVTVAGVSASLQQVAVAVGTGLLPWLVAIWGLVWLQGLLQTRFLWRWRAVFSNWRRLDLRSGVERLAAGQLLRRVGRIAGMCAVATVLFYYAVEPEVFRQLGGRPSDTVPELVGRFTTDLTRLIWRISLVAIVVALADHAWEWWRLEQSLRMTPAELREELRQSEGQPATRQAVRQRGQAERTG